jgi:hypothetical protein
MEIWKDIKGYESNYQISNLGRVKSNYRIKKLKGSITKKGYLSYKLYHINGSKKSFQSHQLVAKAFIDNIDGKTQVNHKDGNKLNNHVDNLEWVTCKENINHAIETGLRDKCINLRKQDLFGNGKINEVRMYIEKGLTNTEISKIYNCHHSTISKIRTNAHYAR